MFYPLFCLLLELFGYHRILNIKGFLLIGFTQYQGPRQEISQQTQFITLITLFSLIEICCVEILLTC